MKSSPASYQYIADLLAERTGQQVSESRLWRIDTALAGVFRQHGITNVDQLVCLLDQNSGHAAGGVAAEEVVEALLNGETYFFRDKPTFDQIPDILLPELAERRQHTKQLSIWCAGCSTGQEVYSLAMLIADQGNRWAGWSFDILGTDVSQQAVTSARSGMYNQFEVQRGLPVAQMLNHFEETEHGWRVHDKLRTSIRFARHNVLDNPPGRRPFDLILCRNVLLYFAPDKRREALAQLHSALAPDGFLMLGASETVNSQTPAFGRAKGYKSLYQPQKTKAGQQIALAG